MVWYYEILGKEDVVLEASEPVYATQFDAIVREILGD